MEGPKRRRASEAKAKNIKLSQVSISHLLNDLDLGLEDERVIFTTILSKLAPYGCEGRFRPYFLLRAKKFQVKVDKATSMKIAKGARSGETNLLVKRPSIVASKSLQ